MLGLKRKEMKMDEKEQAWVLVQELGKINKICLELTYVIGTKKTENKMELENLWNCGIEFRKRIREEWNI
jgi:hypothetical protein